MKKLLFIALSLVLSFSVFAANEEDLKITSISRLTQDIRGNVFEVCARLQNHPEESAVFKIISDPGKRQGVTYQTAYKEANGVISFCQVIGIFGNKVEVVVRGTEVTASRNF